MAARRLLAWGLVGLFPIIVLVLLLEGVIPDPAWMGTNFHFLIVTFTACIALIIAVIMVLAAGQVRDARVVFLTLGFLGIAGVFSVHGLTTPGALVAGSNPWVGFSARLALWVGAACFALSTVNQGHPVERAIVARYREITIGFSIALVIFLGVAMTTSIRDTGITVGTPTTAAASASQADSVAHAADADDEYGDDSGYDARSTSSSAANTPSAVPGMGRFAVLQTQPVSRAVTVATMLLLAVVIYRYVGLYRLSHSALVAGFLASAIFILQAQIILVTTPIWHASWWEYHMLLFAAFITALVGMAIEYARDGSLHGVVEGLLLRDAISQLQRGYTEVIVALVRAVEAKDIYTKGHTQRVADFSVRIAQELRLSPEQLRVVSQAAILHDIGKIGVPDSILNKPGPLTAEEFEVVKQHPVRGHAIIKDVRSLQQEVLGVRHHHERLDGTGYPDGLRDNEIPMVARIIAVADVYDALTSVRPYRGAWSQAQALEFLMQESGQQFDPACVSALRRALRARPAARPANVTEPLVVAVS